MSIGSRSGGAGGGGGGPDTNVNVDSLGGATLAPATVKTDGMSNAGNLQEVGARAQLYNGATWDRGRSGFVGVVSAFVGFQNQVPYGVYHAVAPVLAEGEGAPFLMGPGGQLIVLVANTVDVSGSTVTADQGVAAGPAGGWSVRLTDGAAFYDAANENQLPAALVGGRLDTNVGAWLGSTAPTVGVKTMVDSIPVVIASNQSTVPSVNAPDNVNRSATMGVNLGTDPDVSWGAAAGNVYAVYCTNKNAAKRYLQLFNKASAPVGGDVPVAEFPVAGGIATADGFTEIGTDFFGTEGTYFSTGIATGYSTTSGTYTAGAAGDQVVGIKLT